MKEYIAGGEQSICKLLFTEARGGSADEFLRAGGSGGRLELEELIVIIPFVLLTALIAAH